FDRNDSETWKRLSETETGRYYDARLGNVLGQALEDWAFKGHLSNWLHPGDGGASFKFHEKDPIYELAQRIPVKQGSLLIWDQRCVHGSRPNCSARVRMAQFIRAVRRSSLNKDRAVARARAVLQKVQAAGHLNEVSSVGYEVFGFSDLPEEEYARAKGLNHCCARAGFVGLNCLVQVFLAGERLKLRHCFTMVPAAFSTAGAAFGASWGDAA
ncbi:unnamed protein product, partial [Effrenium voratum]